MVLNETQSILPGGAPQQVRKDFTVVSEPEDRFISSGNAHSGRAPNQLTLRQVSAMMAGSTGSAIQGTTPLQTPAGDAGQTPGIQTGSASAIILGGEANQLLFTPVESNSTALEIVQDRSSGTIFANVADSNTKKSALVVYDEAGVKQWEVPGGEYSRYLKLAPDGKGGVIARDESKITSYDSSGKEQWSYDHLSGVQELYHRWSTQTPIAGSDGTVYYATGRKDPVRRASVNDKNLSVIAVRDGKMQWVFNAQNNVNFDPGLTSMSDGRLVLEAQGEDGFFTGRKHFVICLNPDGTEAFRAKADFTWDFGASRPTPGPDGSLYFLQSGDDCSMVALNADGSQKWKYVINGFGDFPPHDAGKGSVYLPIKDDELVCLDSSSGTERWRKKLPGKVESGVFSNGSELGILGKDEIYYLDDRGNVIDRVPAHKKGSLIKNARGEYFTFKYPAKSVSPLATASPQEIGKKMVEGIEQARADKKEVVITDDSIRIDGITLNRK